jgi:quercetin dioxygenase-like cupin family protein
MHCGIMIGSSLAALALVAAPASAQTSTRTNDSTKTAPSLAARGASLNITRAGSQPSTKGPADWFTGTVRIDPLFTAPAPARIAGATVTFEPGARAAWHTHPLGQTLVVLSGLGRVQREGGPVEEMRPGDVVWIPPNERHWHGASPATAMTHIALQEALDGKVVEWMEHVTDAQYSGEKK